MNNAKQAAILSILFVFLTGMGLALPWVALPYLSYFFNVPFYFLPLAVSANFLGFIVSLIYWPRAWQGCTIKTPLRNAILLAIVGASIAMFAHHYSVFLLGNVILGASLGSVVTFNSTFIIQQTIFRFINHFSLLAVLFSLFLGTVLSGYIFIYLDWRPLFAGFILLAFFYLLIIFYLKPEVTLNSVIPNSGNLLPTQLVWQYGLIDGLLHGYVLAYLIAMPEWYVKQLQLPYQIYAWLAFFPLASYYLGTRLMQFLRQRFSPYPLLFTIVLIAFFTTLLLSAFALLKDPTVSSITLIMSLFALAAGMMSSLFYYLALLKLSKAATIITMSRMSFAAGLLLITTHLSLNSYWELTLYTSITSIILLLLFYGCKSSPPAPKN
ncbi:MAG: hypothetical protein KIT27_04465 [Legionellales bacterium]|nr:hypothetical protein [Legionellales bacterium]